MEPIIRSLIIIFITLAALYADQPQKDTLPFSVRLGYGLANANDFGEVLSGDWQQYYNNTSVYNLDMGWRFWRNVLDFPFDFYLKGGLSYFDEKASYDLRGNGPYRDFLEATFYAKVYGKIDFFGNRIRIGFGEGVSYAGEIPVVEIDDATHHDGTIDKSQKFLNYLDVSADIDIGRLIRVAPLRDLYLGYTLKHRSSVFGLYGGALNGSNYNMVTLEKNF